MRIYIHWERQNMYLSLSQCSLEFDNSVFCWSIYQITWKFQNCLINRVPNGEHIHLQSEQEVLHVQCMPKSCCLAGRLSLQGKISQFSFIYVKFHNSLRAFLDSLWLSLQCECSFVCMCVYLDLLVFHNSWGWGFSWI